jgi:ceramide glucosyltransferase
MLTAVLSLIVLFLCAANLASTLYILATIWRVNRFQRTHMSQTGFRPPVTLLKPVCGLDPGLYENLRSFCVQDYPRYQVVFGVRNPEDPAIPLVRRLIAELPHIDISLIIDTRVTGPNLKVSNLRNMYVAAKYPYLIIADSDMRVDPSYVASVIAPLEDAEIGLVTCLYFGTSAGGFASTLATMFINEWFLPSVFVSAVLDDIRFGLGATLALRRDFLESIGSFQMLSYHLADDYMLGKLASSRGLKVALSRYVVENIVYEKNLRHLFNHELRWARTIRTVSPLGHAFSFLMYGIPMALFAWLAIHITFDWDMLGFAIIAAAVALRVGLHFTVRRKLGVASNPLIFILLPLRDILSFLVWGASFFGHKVNWKDTALRVDPDGTIKFAKGFEA